MDELKFNKLAAGILCGVLLIMAGVKTAEVLLPHHELAENTYPIAVAEVASSANVAAVPKKAEPILAMIASADIAAGEKLGKKCAACHSFNDGGKAKIGPNLWNIVGAPSGRDDAFSYSAAMSAANVNWSYSTLNNFLHKPKQWLSGTKMNYVGIKKAQDRANVIAWLRALSATPMGLPSAEDIAAETPNS